MSFLKGFSHLHISLLWVINFKVEWNWKVLGVLNEHSSDIYIHTAQAHSARYQLITRAGSASDIKIVKYALISSPKVLWSLCDKIEANNKIVRRIEKVYVQKGGYFCACPKETKRARRKGFTISHYPFSKKKKNLWTHINHTNTANCFKRPPLTI